MKGNTFESGIETITSKIATVIFTPIIWILTGGAIVLFFYGLANFILNSDGENKEAGKTHMIYGLVGLFVIFGVWGFVELIGDTVQSFK